MRTLLAFAGASLAGAIALGSATGAQSSTQSRFLDAAQLRCTVMFKKGEETRSVVIRLVFADASGKDANFKPHWKLEKDGEQGAIENARVDSGERRFTTKDGEARTDLAVTANGSVRLVSVQRVGDQINRPIYFKGTCEVSGGE